MMLSVFSGVLGGKRWFRSLTGIGLVILAGGETYCLVAEASSLPFGEIVCDASVKMGVFLGMMGIRKAATSPNSE